MPESNQPNYRYIMDNLFKWVFLSASLTLWSHHFSSGANGIFVPQVCHRHPGAAGGRELHDRLFERGHVPEEDADCQLAAKMLPADRPQVSRCGDHDVSQLLSPWILHRLRKNLKSLIIVHPSWFIRTLLALTKPFIRSEVALTTKQRSWDGLPDSDPCSSFHSSKFSQKIQYVYSLADLAELVPMEYVSIPDCIKQWVFAQTRSVVGLLKQIWLMGIVICINLWTVVEPASGL